MANNKTESSEKTLFKTANKLHKNVDAAEYRHIFEVKMSGFSALKDRMDEEIKKLKNVGFILE